MASIPTAWSLSSTEASGSRRAASASLTVDPTEIPGDGETPVAEPLQRLLYRLAENGGGVALLPPGRYLLEKTLLIPSRVHLIGHGVGTVLTGYRPGEVNGYALLANDGITTARGYDGAHDFSVQHLAIDSPRTNGIVLVHARNGYFTNIHGLDAFHHHFDIAGSQNILTENIYLTGRSGTAPYQIDGSPYNNNIWDGETNVRPIRDDTPNDGIFLSNSVIRPKNRPDRGLHLHRRGGRNIFVDNVVIEHVQTGIDRDPDCSRDDLFLTNITIRDVSRHAVNFRPSQTRDRRVTFQNISIAECASPTAFEYHSGEDLVLSNIRIESDTPESQIALRDVDSGTLSDLFCRGHGTGAALQLHRCRNLFLSRIHARALPIAVQLEESANVQLSGLITCAADGIAVAPKIVGSDFLAKWTTS